MNNTKIALIVAGVMVLVAFMFGMNLKAPITTERVTERTVSGVSSPDVSSPYISIGGLQTWQGNIAMNSATSGEPCVIDNPSPGTTTIAMLSVQVDANSTGATQNLFFSTTTKATSGLTYGTSTMALTGAIAVGTGHTSYAWRGNNATSTDASTAASGVNILPGQNFSGNLFSGGSNYFLKPNESITLMIASATPGTIATGLTGTCGYKLERL